MTDDHVRTLDKDTPDYYGSDVSSVSNIPDGFNEVSREEPYEESDTSSATDGLNDGFLDRAPDDHIGPDQTTHVNDHEVLLDLLTLALPEASMFSG